jgi:NADPH:quinone reductase-like Zn-dependent oxidoreductase
VKDGGRIITLLTFFTDEKLVQKVREKKVYTHRLGVISAGSDMEQIAALLQSGRLRSHISARFAFDEMAQAHQAIVSGKTTGKIVVSV